MKRIQTSKFVDSQKLKSIEMLQRKTEIRLQFKINIKKEIQKIVEENVSFREFSFTLNPIIESTTLTTRCKITSQRRENIIKL